MTESLRIELELEYGNLLQQLETVFDWFEKRKIQKKLNAINCLLGAPQIKKQEPNLYKIGIDPITSTKSSVGIFQGKDYINLHNNRK